jgi:hypothetical protein
MVASKCSCSAAVSTGSSAGRSRVGTDISVPSFATAGGHLLTAWSVISVHDARTPHNPGCADGVPGLDSGVAGEFIT